MSETKGKAYIDTIQGYLNPRIYVALGLGGSTNISDVFNSSTKLYPNPCNNSLNIVNYASEIDNITIFNLNGQEVLNKDFSTNLIKINTSKLEKGLYIVDVKSNNISIKRKLVIE